jgi:predicted dehydrogenase
MNNKIAILGTGTIAVKRYQSVLNLNKNYQIFIGSSNKKRAFDFSKKKNVFYCGTYDDIINNKEISKVIICNETFKHYNLIKKCLNNNKNILCEKPLTMTVSEAKKLKNIALKKKLVLTCGLNHRFYPAIKDLKTLLQKKNLGKLLHINSKYCYSGRNKETYDKEWRTNLNKSSGGIIIEHTIHLIDLIFYLFGKPKEIKIMTENNYYEKKNLEETMAMSIKLKNNNAIANIFSSCTYWKNIFKLNIVFENGYYEIINPNPSYGKCFFKIGLRNHHKPFEYKTKEYSNIDYSFRNELNNFFTLVKKKLYKNTNIDEVINLQKIYENYKKNYFK